MKNVISVVTGSRADFGLLEGVISNILDSPNLELELIVTGSHLSDVFGRTSNQIRLSGHAKIVAIEINVEIDSETELTIAIGDLVQKIATHYSKKKPSLTLVLGDRYEMLGVAVACATLGIPLAHIHGGEITAGSKDDMYRHAITKLASLHFVANSEFRSRVIRMGENPGTVFVVGGLGVDSINLTEIFSKSELEMRLGIRLGEKYALITFHPDSINPESSLVQLRIILNSIAKFPEIQFIVTGANADYYGNQINLVIKEILKQYENIIFFESLGQQNYFSLLSAAKFVLGNSSSGLLEAPSFGIPTLNIGPRQNGRPKANSVIDLDCEESEIIDGIKKVTTEAHSSTQLNIENPYGNPGASVKIVEILEACNFEELLPKRFTDAN